ncbi:MAG: hypothetical protein KF812_07345 [Fimbriimonadaceae bacterium]|nr:hypothetical protein [Fimbriimonadaceae bacterium]
MRIVSLNGELVCEDTCRDGRRSEGFPPGGLYDHETARILQAWWEVDGPVWELRGGTVEFEATQPIALGWAGASTTHQVDRMILDTGERLKLAPRRPGATLAIVSGKRWLAQSGTKVAEGDPVLGGGLTRLPPEGTLALLPGANDLRVRYLPRQGIPRIEGDWAVSIRADRIGIMLTGEQQFYQSHGRSIPTNFGAIQNPGDGQLIVVGPDGPTVGGYPVVGAVIRADRPKIARWAPGDTVSFLPVTMDEAEQAWTQAQRQLRDHVRRTTALRKALG